MRQLLCLALLAAAAGTATAQDPGDQGAPTPIQTLVAPPMDQSPVQIKSGDPVVSAHVTRNADAVAACLPDGQMLKLRIHMVWSAKGTPRTIALYGGRAAFQRRRSDSAGPEQAQAQELEVRQHLAREPTLCRTGEPGARAGLPAEGPGRKTQGQPRVLHDTQRA